MIFQCSACHVVVSVWTARCLDCGGDCTFKEITATEACAHQRRMARIAAANSDGESMTDLRDYTEEPAEPARAKRLDEIEDEHLVRLPTREPGLDRILSGGFVGSFIYALHSPGGAGKSRIALRCACRLCKLGTVLYVTTSFEEPEKAVRRHVRDAKFEKFAFVKSRLRVLQQDDPEFVAAWIEQNEPAFVVIDSLSTLWNEMVPGDRGSAAQIKYAMDLLRKSMQRLRNSAMLALLHENKDGKVAGPLTVSYLFDVMLRIQRVQWVPPSTAPTGDRLPGRYDVTDKPSKTVHLQSTGKSRESDPEAFQIYQLTKTGISPVQADRRAPRIEGYEATATA